MSWKDGREDEVGVRGGKGGRGETTTILEDGKMSGRTRRCRGRTDERTRWKYEVVTVKVVEQ